MYYEMKTVPCGRTTGHGETCVEDRLCGHCSIIKKLKKELNIIKKGNKNIMQFKEYSDSIKQFVCYPKKDVFNYLAMGISEEVGEIAGKHKKRLRGDEGKSKITDDMIVKEIGDACWYFTRIVCEVWGEDKDFKCDEFNMRFDPNAIMQLNIYQRVSVLNNYAGQLSVALTDIVPERLGFFRGNRHFIGLINSIYFLLMDIASHYNKQIGEVFIDNFNKLKDRMERNTLKGSGDER